MTLFKAIYYHIDKITLENLRKLAGLSKLV